LIDGERLTDLMLQYKIGVRVERHADILALDQNYFEEE
jgi:restriction endonuclease Mrr